MFLGTPKCVRRRGHLWPGMRSERTSVDQMSLAGLQFIQNIPTLNPRETAANWPYFIDDLYSD